jgi:hypothetical protein
VQQNPEIPIPNQIQEKETLSLSRNSPGYSMEVEFPEAIFTRKSRKSFSVRTNELGFLWLHKDKKLMALGSSCSR